MNNNQKGILLLIKSAFTGEKYALPEGISMAKLYFCAMAHNITTLVYNGAQNCGIQEIGEHAEQVITQVCTDLVVSEMQICTINDLLAEFEKNGIDYMQLKGINMKKLYPKPEMRFMSDVDILVKVEQYDKISEIMQTLGYTPDKESDHELIWTNEEVTVELHKRLIPSYNKDYYAYFGDGWRLAVKNAEKNGEHYLKKEDEFIFLFTHLCKHYRDAGVGLRHFLDVWVYRQSHTDLNEEYIHKELKKLKVYEFYQNVLHTLDVWFHGGQNNEITNYITNVAFCGGPFKNEAHVLSSTLKGMKQGKSVKQVKRERYINAIFTPYKVMCAYYPFLKKCKILLPFMWIYHFFRRLFTKGKLKNYNKQMSGMKEKDVKSYQQSLNFVGLDYNFEQEMEN